ncbi:ABC transporter ATP-binding protein [Sedimentibacter sp. MB31-C6]|uniref:ABC transporter ATP-binding protein n=1 Tax=Sedimentibacter sp. MB31-C6 TaxID=3109366 RepID=UPI002DDD7A36|nr:ABC transporter ATP-binding protein [Sedimentibacter sp. MB36-C1]WSI05173.1 ABC transporter ATP-binding protein [Sedimentibacter sp. MB36-C1]
MISFKNISKIYNDSYILKNFNITFDDNKITCLFGPSGVGKTTIANILAGLIQVDSGNITGTENSLYSYVFQEPRLLKWYSVYDNIDFVLRDVYELDERKKIIENYINMVELFNYKDYLPKNLSGGMAQRVSLARAFAYPSNILIMDEPFKGLDLKLKKEMIQSFLKLWSKSKRTVIFITHDIEEASSLSDTIYYIKNHPAEIIKKISKNNDINNDEIKKLLLNLSS